MISAAVVTRLFIMYTFYCVQFVHVLLCPVCTRFCVSRLYTFLCVPFVHVLGKGRGCALC